MITHYRLLQNQFFRKLLATRKGGLKNKLIITQSNISSQEKNWKVKFFHHLKGKVLMDTKEIQAFRQRLGKTQKQMSQLLGLSLRAVQIF